MKKYEKVIFWAGVFFIILITIISKPLTDLDEIWNFNIARCISNGLVPFKDISMVSMPLLGFIVSIFLKIFGSEMFVTRILAVCLTMGILILIYIISKKIEIQQIVIYALLAVIIYMYVKYFCLDYNFFIVFLSLIILFLEIKNIKSEKNNFKIHFLIGIIGGFSICTKQSIGILICAIIILNQIFFIKSKKDLKICLKSIIIRALGISIPVIIFILYLLINNAFNDFLDYCIFGIKTFSNKIPYIKLIKSTEIYIKILSIVIPIILCISVIFNITMKLINKEDKILYIITAYCLPIFAIVYPISDNIHFLIGIIPTLILIVYIISKIIYKCKQKFNIKLNLLSLFVNVLVIVFIIIFNGYIEFQNNEVLGNLTKYTKINHFRYIQVSNNMVNLVNETDNYIKSSDKKVYILDASAALYMIPIDRYNKNYDMFLKGNLGSGGEESQIQNIKNEKAKYLIIGDNYNRNWQNPEKVRKYIKENLNKIQSIGMYDIYE